MRIGIKYCGGCNPIFDRKKLAENISDEYAGCSFEPVRDDVFYDAVLIINGCGRACGGHEKLKTAEKIFVNKPSDIEKIRKILG